MPLKDKIQLQNANMFQETVDNTKQDWIVRENISGVQLATFPANVSDQMMFKIIKFARQYELKAFNTGIQFGKTQVDTHADECAFLKEQLRESIVHSDKLAEKLNQLLNTEE